MIKHWKVVEKYFFLFVTLPTVIRDSFTVIVDEINKSSLLVIFYSSRLDSPVGFVAKYLRSIFPDMQML